VVWYRTGEIVGAGVWHPKSGTYKIVRSDGPFDARVRDEFAHLIAQDIAAALWPGPSTGMRLPASVAQALPDPQTLVIRLIGAIAQAAAIHAGFPPAVAKMVGQVAQDLSSKLFGQDPDARKMQVAEYLDFTFSYADGSRTDGPGLPEIGVDQAASVIDDLLGADWKSPIRYPPEIEDMRTDDLGPGF
jgi:hypothetical protein